MSEMNNSTQFQFTNDVGSLLPAGTVVTLKDADKSLMIIGILPENQEQRYDYIAVLYPEGYLTAQELFMFNQGDIERVEFLGYMDVQYQAFRSTLRAALEKETNA